MAGAWLNGRTRDLFSPIRAAGGQWGCGEGEGYCPERQVPATQRSPAAVSEGLDQAILISVLGGLDLHTICV